MSIVTSQYVTSPTGESEVASYFEISDKRERFTLFNVMTPGDEYTVSFWVKSSATSHVVLNGSTYASSTEWTKHVGVFTAKGTDLTMGFNDAGAYYIYHIKLERGNMATEWSAAPEDTEEDINNALNKAWEAHEIADEAVNKVAITETAIQLLNDCIKTLVRDASGKTLMTQDGQKWMFSMGDYDQSLENMSNDMTALNNKANDTDNAVNVLTQKVGDLGVMSEYVVITTYNNQPCIELGKIGSDFKVRITNTEIQFIQGAAIPAYINNQKLMIDQAEVKNDLQFGGFVWKKRSNGNMGIVWKGESS